MIEQLSKHDRIQHSKNYGKQLFSFLCIYFVEQCNFQIKFRSLLFGLLINFKN